MAAPLCFIDTETDGLHPERKAWEIAMIRREEDGSERRIEFFVEADLSTADPFGLKVGGFYDRHPLGRRISNGGYTVCKGQYDQINDGSQPGPEVLSEADAALKVARFTHGAHLVGAVPNFDADIFARLLRENGLTPTWHHHLIDIEAMAVGYLLGIGKPVIVPWKSDALSAACGVTPPDKSERHTAMGDAEWVIDWFDAISGGLQ